MELKSGGEAVVRALEWMGLPPTHSAAVHRVHRLDAPSSAYYLVQAGDRLVSLDEKTGEVLSSARGLRTSVVLEPTAALACGGLGSTTQIRLVWKPCAATLSMLDPVWEIRTDEHIVYVDQRGRHWETLPLKQPGGGPPI
jgi:hypothetical protein